MSKREFFRGKAKTQTVYRATRRVTEHLDGVEAGVSKSQMGFYCKHPFASVWKTGQYLKGEHPPLALTIFLRRRDASGRWKEVVEPQPGRFTHHMELGAAADVDDEVRGWIIEAWREARRSVFDDFLPFDGRQVNRGFQINTGRLPGIVKSGHCQHAFLAKADCDRAYTIPE